MSLDPLHLLDLSIEILRRFATPLILIAAYFAWKAARPRLRRKLFESWLGDTGREWPELDGLLFSAIGKAGGRLDCESLFNYVLVDRPSATTRALLAAYALTARRIVLEPKEEMIGELCISEGVLSVAIHTCVYARGTRPSLKVLDHSEMIAWMFQVSSLAHALETLGLTRLKVKYYLSLRKPLPETEDPGVIQSGIEQAWIRIHDDRFSSEDLVTKILSEVFGRDAESAARITNDVQRSGFAAVGPYPPDDATVRIRRAIGMARAADAPLMLSLATEDPDKLAAAQNAMNKIAERNPYAVPRSARF